MPPLPCATDESAVSHCLTKSYMITKVAAKNRCLNFFQPPQTPPLNPPPPPQIPRWLVPLLFKPWLPTLMPYVSLVSTYFPISKKELQFSKKLAHMISLFDCLNATSRSLDKRICEAPEKCN